ncbi:MAG TPA: carboxymuconolactone decarboxylase family protein [Rhodocyclaceae bacterium]|nr:carboxymuconolactone decarboxylase family protein [Rhodocyclaceae bacterium]
MLDERTRELIAIGASITANCQPCLAYHTAKAQELGASGEDMLAAVDVGRQVRCGAAAKMDRHSARTVAGQEVAEPPPGCDCK